MITSSDRDYKTTKRVKQGKKKLKPPFDELGQWISIRWKVNVLNVIYSRRNSLHAPRIKVILEYAAHERKFRRGVNFNSSKQKAIATKFLEIIANAGDTKFDVDGLFVVFSAFAPIAKEEADSQIPDKAVEVLKSQIGDPNLWEISRCFGHVTFFFYTDEQAKQAELKGLQESYAELYFQLLKPHDEFGYLRRKDFKVAFDSKQNFDENFESNWFYYYR